MTRLTSTGEIISASAPAAVPGPAPAAARGDFDPAKHPRGYHGRFGHRVGPARKSRTGQHPGQYRDQLSGYWRNETDPEAKQYLNLAGATYDDNQYDQPADLLRNAAGRVGPLGRTSDRDKYNTLADAIEKQGQDNGISHTTQLLNAISTEREATNVEPVTDQLRNAYRIIESASQGTSWRSQAAGYLRNAADLARATGDPAGARRYENLAHRATHLPDEQAPGDRDVRALLAKAAPAVPGLLGGGESRWNGKIGTFTPEQHPDYLGFTYPDGHVEFRTDVVNGLLDAQAHPDQVMPNPDNLDVVLHELIHDTTGGRTDQDKKDWAALPQRDRDLLTQVDQLDSESPAGGAYPIAHTLDEVRSRDFGRTTQAEIDSLTSRGLLRKADFKDGTTDPAGRTTYVPLWLLTSKTLRLLPHRRGEDDTDAYTSASGHDIEEGFTELGSTQHMEGFAAAEGFGQVMTPRLSQAPLGHIPTLKQLDPVHGEIRDIYKQQGDSSGPGSMEAYNALGSAVQETSAQHPDPAKITGYLAQAARATPDAAVRARLGALFKKLGITGGGTVDNPAYDKAKNDLLDSLRAEQRNLEADGRPPQQQAAQHLAAVITDVEHDMPDEAGDVITEIQHLGDRAALARQLRGKLDTLTATPAARHDTVPEYARNLADPAKLATGRSWGHYPHLTANAQQWVQAIARAEHKTGFDKQGTAGYKRTVALADEINREGTAGKISVMARQVLRSLGIDPDTADPAVLVDVRNEITDRYGDVDSPGHGAAAAFRRARQTARQELAGYRKQGGIETRWSAAAPAGDDADVPPVTVTLTPDGAKAEQIRARAWRDPAFLEQAITQIRQLAEQTTDPAALRQVQDAGRSLHMLAAIRDRAPDTAAAFNPGQPRDPHTGKWVSDHAGTQPPGGARAPHTPLEPALPAEPAPTWPGPPATPVAQVAARLAKAIKSNHEQDTKPGQDIAIEQPEGVNYFGNTADTSVVTFADGSKWVRKRALPDIGMNREIAYSRMAGALGIPAPVVIKRQNPGGWHEIYEPYVNGIPAIEWTGGYDPDPNIEDPVRDTPPPGRDPARLYDSPEGRMIGMADMLAGTEERHLGNWMVTTDAHGDHPVPIDNNDADFNPFMTSITPFADFNPAQLAPEHPARQWAAWQANLEGLREVFAGLGMTEEWRNVMSNFAGVKQQAGIP